MLKKIFPFLYKTRWRLKPNTDHEVQVAFISGGVEYFMFVNEQKIPYERAMAAMDIWVEFEERTDKKYHKSAYESIIEYCKQGNLIQAANVAEFAIQRMDNISNADLMYKLASVLYFDANENCYSYDYEYNEKKINKWRAEKDIEGFFLKTPLADLLPSLPTSVMSFLEYTQAQRKELMYHLKDRLSKLSKGSKNHDLISTLELQIKELEELITKN